MKCYVVFVDSELCDLPSYYAKVFVYALSKEEALEKVLSRYPQMGTYRQKRLDPEYLKLYPGTKPWEAEEVKDFHYELFD